MRRLAALALLLACAHAPAGLQQRRELAALRRELSKAPPEDANRALNALSLLGPAALPELPAVLARADREDLDPDGLAAALEAMGPGCIPTLEAHLRDQPAWAEGGLDGLARLGDPAMAPLLRLSELPALHDAALDKIRVMVTWAHHPWVTPGQRQTHPYRFPSMQFTPIDLSTWGPVLEETTCARYQVSRGREATRAVEMLSALQDGHCAVALLRSEDPAQIRLAIRVIPERGPDLAEVLQALGALLGAGVEDESLRGQLCYALERLPRDTPGLSETLETLLLDGARETRAVLIGDLRWWYSAPVPPDLLPRLLARDADPELRTLELRLLAWQHIADEPTLRRVVQLGGESAGEAAEAIAALRIVQRSFHDTLVEISLDRDLSPYTRGVAALGLLSNRPPEVASAALNLLWSPDQAWRALAVAEYTRGSGEYNLSADLRARAALRVVALRDPAPELRLAALQILWDMLYERNLMVEDRALLVAALHGPDRALAAEARRLLDAIEQQHAAFGEAGR